MRRPFPDDEMHPAELHPALLGSRRELNVYDCHRDLREVRARVRALAKTGLTDAEIAAETRLSDRQVLRIRHRQVMELVDTRPQLPDPETITDERVDQLEHTTDLTLRLAELLRDEDPCLVWLTLSRLSRQELQELAVVALAALPLDSGVADIFAWITNLTGFTAERAS